MSGFLKLIALFFVSINLLGQEVEIDRLIQNDLKMTFPSIYFKHNSTEYAGMPYKADSCFKYIALHYEKNMNSLVVWRDSLENEQLTTERIKKLRVQLRKYIKVGTIEIESMGTKQKISRQTLKKTADSAKVNYLLTLNSVFEFSKTRLTINTNDSHIFHPKIWCRSCWKHGFHLNKRGREMRQNARKSKRDQQSSEKKTKNKKERKGIPRLVWTGWKTGFHWSSTGSVSKKKK